LRGGSFSLRQITCSTNYVRAVRGKGARGFDSDSGGNASYQDPFAVQINSGQNFFCS